MDHSGSVNNEDVEVHDQQKRAHNNAEQVPTLNTQSQQLIINPATKNGTTYSTIGAKTTQKYTGKIPVKTSIAASQGPCRIPNTLSTTRRCTGRIPKKEITSPETRSMSKRNVSQKPISFLQTPKQ